MPMQCTQTPMTDSPWLAIYDNHGFDPCRKSWSFNFACVVIGLPDLAPYIENTVYSIQTMFLDDDLKIVQFLLFLFTCEWGLGPN